MFYFISELVFFLSLGTMIYILAGKLPVINDSFDGGGNSSIPRRSKIISKFSWLGVLDKKFTDFLEKFLRKSKLILMKLDNFVAHHLENVRGRNANGNNTEGEQSVIKDLHSEVTENKTEEQKEENV